MRPYIFVAFAIIVFAACQPATTELTEEQKAEIAAEVTLRLDAVWNELKQPDFDRLGAFFVRALGTTRVSNGRFSEWTPTSDSISRATLAQWKDQVLTTSETRVDVLSPDVVYTMRVGTDSVTLKSGEATPTRPWGWTLVWVRSNGEWKVLHVHGSHPLFSNS